jgi:hypothetical protein
MRTTTSTLRSTLAAAFLAGSALIGTGAYAAAADAAGPAVAGERAGQRDEAAAPTAHLTQLYRPRFAEPLATP